MKTIQENYNVPPTDIIKPTISIRRISYAQAAKGKSSQRVTNKKGTTTTNAMPSPPVKTETSVEATPDKFGSVLTELKDAIVGLQKVISPNQSAKELSKVKRELNELKREMSEQSATPAITTNLRSEFEQIKLQVSQDKDAMKKEFEILKENV